jgi:hypothetical protein
MRLMYILLIIIFLSCIPWLTDIVFSKPPYPYGKPDCITKIDSKRICYSYICYKGNYRILIYYKTDNKWELFRERSSKCMTDPLFLDEDDPSCYEGVN